MVILEIYINKYTQAANYSLISQNKKPETHLDFEKIPDVKSIVLDILSLDKVFWDNCGQKQQGIEKFNLLSKVSAKIKINSNVFYIALDQLEGEQRIIPEIKDNKVRYSLFTFNI